MRLIDADKYKGKVICNHAYSGVKRLVNVDDVPTAYDVQEVVNKLDMIHWHSIDDRNDAIAIVQQGGKTDDMCEWKYDDNEYCWETSCDHLHVFMYDGPEENKYWFCPYCGRKIKICHIGR